jgi:hypothetical protein
VRPLWNAILGDLKSNIGVFTQTGAKSVMGDFSSAAEHFFKLTKPPGWSAVEFFFSSFFPQYFEHPKIMYSNMPTATVSPENFVIHDTSILG